MSSPPRGQKEKSDRVQKQLPICLSVSLSAWQMIPAPACTMCQRSLTEGGKTRLWQQIQQLAKFTFHIGHFWEPSTCLGGNKNKVASEWRRYHGWPTENHHLWGSVSVDDDQLCLCVMWLKGSFDIIKIIVIQDWPANRKMGLIITRWCAFEGMI